MARLLIALTIAVGAHGLLLAMRLDGWKRETPTRPVPQVVTMTLGYRQPPPKRLLEPTVNKTEAATKIKRRRRTKETGPVKPEPAATPRASRKAAVEKKEAPPKKKVDRPRRTSIKPAPDSAQTIASTPVTPEPLPQEPPRGGDTDATASQSALVREATPLYRLNTPPRYPRSARRRGHEGTVMLEVLVVRDGTVGELRVAASSGYSVLDRAAAAAVREWVFDPGRRGDEATDMWVRVPIRFALQ